MKFKSTRGKCPVVGAKVAMLQGLAPDGGLYVPLAFPKLTIDKQAIRTMGLQNLGAKILQAWFDGEIPAEALHSIARQALDFEIPLRQVGTHEVLELFHGPTLAFKDIAARCLARLMEFTLAKNQEKRTVIVATSGDTGGAVAQGFAGMSNIRVIILFPAHGVSVLQRQQLTRVAPNVLPVEVDGGFDACQRIVKRALADPKLNNLHLSTANSINIGRLIPQIIYYYWAWAHSVQEEPKFVIPSGNYGNLTAALWAKKMGMPMASIVAAVNANKTTENYYKTGTYKPLPTTKTLANAMDIGNPSNFERVLYEFGNDQKTFSKFIQVVSVGDEEITSTILNVHAQYGYTLDPHTAVAWHASEVSGFSDSIIVSTASPKKFSEVLEHKAGLPQNTKQLEQQLQTLPRRGVKSSANYDEICTHIKAWE